MTAGVVTAMVGFGMYSYSKLYPSRLEEDAWRSDTSPGTAYKPVKTSDAGTLDKCKFIYKEPSQ